MKKQTLITSMKIKHPVTLGLLTCSIIFGQVVAAFGDYASVVINDVPSHYWPLQETNTSQPAADLGAPGGNPGTYNQDVPGGILLGQTTSPTTLGGTCAYFDGANGTFVDLGNFHPGNSTTIEAWINAASDASATYKSIIARWAGSYELDLSGTDVADWDVYSSPGGAFSQAAAANPVTRGQWYYQVGIYDAGAGTISLYLNGNLVSKEQVTGVLQNLGNNIPDHVLIASTRGGSAGFNFRGLIAQVAVYNYPLTAQQIANHYNAGLYFSGATNAAPVLVSQAAATIQWPSFGGYSLQVTSSLVSSNWLNYTSVQTGTPVISEGPATSMVVVPFNGSSQFYRTVNSSIFHP